MDDDELERKIGFEYQVSSGQCPCLENALEFNLVSQTKPTNTK